MGRMEAEKTLASALEMVPKSGLKSVSKANYLIAQNVVHEEIGLYGEYAFEYRFNQKTSDLLLAHGRQDAAHALLNTSSLLEHGGQISTQLRVLNALALAAVCMLGAIVVKLYPQILSGLH
jgi:hypothetical protein